MGNLVRFLLLSICTTSYAVAQVGPRPRVSGGCACPCNAGPVKVLIWKPEQGAMDEFIARAIKAGYRRGEPLVLLGRSPRGFWSVETSGDESEMRVDLVCTTAEGKRERLSLVTSYPQASYGDPKATSSGVALRVLRGLHRLERSGRFHPEELQPIEPPLLSNYPRLILRESGNLDGGEYSWTLGAKTGTGHFALVASGKPNLPNGSEFYRGSRCIAGIPDGAGGEIWWVSIALAAGDDCSNEWRTVGINPASSRTH